MDLDAKLCKEGDVQYRPKETLQLFSWKIGNLVATNWLIEKALHAIGCNQIPTN